MALKEAQEKGYAEADPSLDIDGWDSAHKIAILSFIAFGAFFPLFPCVCGGYKAGGPFGCGAWKRIGIYPPHTHGKRGRKLQRL